MVVRHQRRQNLTAEPLSRCLLRCHLNRLGNATRLQTRPQKKDGSIRASFRVLAALFITVTVLVEPRAHQILVFRELIS